MTQDGKTQNCHNEKVLDKYHSNLLISYPVIASIEIFSPWHSHCFDFCMYRIFLEEVPYEININDEFYDSVNELIPCCLQ